MSSVDIAGSVFGNIPGIPVGTRWVNRLAMSQDHIHPPLVAGIYGRKEDGARSVVLGGIYDDEDHGETFTYIGSGGRAPGVRFGAQTVDQTFDNNLNQALRSSAKRQVPVRVIRGPKLQSRYTPYAGFRYDGLYTVHNPRQEVGPNGLKICKFDFRRLPGQPPLPELEDRLPDDIEIRREQFRATRKRRTHGGEAERGERPITAKWEGAGSAPAPAPAPRATLAVAAGPVARTSSASTIRPRPREKTQTTTQRRVFSSTTGSGSANSSRAGTPSSGAFGPPASSSIRSGSVQPENASESLDVDPREFGFDDSDEDPEGEDADRDEDDEGEDDEDQDDILYASFALLGCE